MNRQRGFTLIELIITMAIAAIVVTIGVPSFQAMMRNNRVAAHTNEFMSSLNLARSEAIKRGVQVALCPSSNQSTCATAWGTNGWIVFVDTDNNGSLNGGEPLLRVYQFDGNDTLVNTSFPGTDISFTSRGRVASGGSLFLSACDANDQQNVITITPVGRARVSQQPGSACP